MELEKTALIEQDLEIWKNLFLEEKKLSSSILTIKSYKNRIEKFIEYCYLERINNNDEKLRITDINRYFILGFITYLKEEIERIKKSHSNNSIKTYIDTLKSFFMYISENNDDLVDLTTAFKKVHIKTEMKIKTAFSINEINKIEKTLKEELEKNLIFSKYRNYLMLYMLLKTGMRGFEVLNLKNDSISIENSLYIIKIKGKGNKERINFIKKDEIGEYFERYFSKRMDMNIESQYLFPNKEGKPLSRFNIYKFNTRFLEKLLIRKTGLHIYRHSFARLMVAKKENLATISQWLGHSDISITHKYYARANEEDLKNMIIK